MSVAPVWAADVPNAVQLPNSAASTLGFGLNENTCGWAIDASIGFIVSEAGALGIVTTYGEIDRELVINGAIEFSPDTDGPLTTTTMYSLEGNLVLNTIPGMIAKLCAYYEQIDWYDDSDPTEGWATLSLAQELG